MNSDKLQLLQSDVNMEAAESDTDRKLLNISELNVMTKNFWNTQQTKAESAKSFLKTTMRNQPTVFCILW